MTTWYLFRHALATHSTEGYGDRIWNATILPEAIPPIERMAMFLKQTGESENYRSEIIRCRQTAEIITGITDRQFVPDNRLNEYHDIQFPDFIARIHGWLGERQAEKPDNILVCTHGAVIAAIRHLLLDGKVREENLLDYPQCGQLLIIKKKTVQVLDFNEGD